MTARGRGTDQFTNEQSASIEARGGPAPLPSEMAGHYIYGTGQPSGDYECYGQQDSAGGPASGHHHGHPYLRPCTGVVQYHGHGAGSFAYAAPAEFSFHQPGAAASCGAAPGHTGHNAYTATYVTAPHTLPAQHPFMVRCCPKRLQTESESLSSDSLASLATSLGSPHELSPPCSPILLQNQLLPVTLFASLRS